MRFALTFAALTLALSAAAAQQTVTCATNGPQRQFCRADTHDGVLLVRDHSHGACHYGDSWGFNEHGIFVSNGCNADFLVTDHHGPYGQQDQGYGNPGGPPPYDPGQDREGPHHVLIPAGTQIQVNLNQGVSANNAQPGQTVSANLTSDLVVNGMRIAHAGTPVALTITSIHPDRQYPLTVQLTGMTVHHESYVFNTTAIHSGSDAINAQNNGNGLGAALGNILDGNQNANLPPGSVYNFQLLAPAQPFPAN